MKVITPELTASISNMRMMEKDMEFKLDENDNDNNNSNCQPEEFVNVIDFIRGDPRLPDRYVFDRERFPDYSRATQRRLVAYIQEACERQNSPVSVHQWANEEHDDRTVRRIRFRCAFFRKKKRRQGAPCCLFQFQVCYQEQYGWCLLNGKGQHRHNGHPLAVSTKGTNNNNNKSFRSHTAKTATPKPALTKSANNKLPPATPRTNVDLQKVKAVPVPASPPHVASCMSCTPLSCSSSHARNTNKNYKSNKMESNSRFAADAHVPPVKESSWDSKTDPAYLDFALDSTLDDMDWDLFNEVIGLPENEEEPPAEAAVATSITETPFAVPSTMPDGMLQKTILLNETPFPQVTSLDDKCAGIILALRNYSEAHGFAVTVEDFATVDRPGERTMRIVLHCLGGHCCYQVALLWVVGLTKWHIYCQPDGIFVHGCGRLEGKNAPVASSAMAATPLNQALDHLADFLNGEVVCPDMDEDQQQFYRNAGALCWKKEEEKEVSENVRKETRKAVVKVAGVDATASAA